MNRDDGGRPDRIGPPHRGHGSIATWTLGAGQFIWRARRSGGRRLRGRQRSARATGWPPASSAPRRHRCDWPTSVRAGATDCIVHRHDAVIVERDDCIAVPHAGQPNLLIGATFCCCPEVPADDALDHWMARFEVEIAQRQPESQHRAFGINTPGAHAELPSWVCAGFEVQVHDAMQLAPGRLRAPPRAARGDVVFRPAHLDARDRCLRRAAVR